MSRKDRDAFPEKDDKNRKGLPDDAMGLNPDESLDKQDRVAASEGDVAAERAEDDRKENKGPIDPALTRATDRDIASAQGAVTNREIPAASAPAGVNHPGGAANPDSPAAAADALPAPAGTAGAEGAPVDENGKVIQAQNPNSNIAVGTHRPVNYGRPATPQPGRC